MGGGSCGSVAGGKKCGGEAVKGNQRREGPPV